MVYMALGEAAGAGAFSVGSGTRWRRGRGGRVYKPRRRESRSWAGGTRREKL